MSTKNLRPHRLAIRTAVAAALLSMLGASRAATFDVYARENSTAFSNNNISPAASPLDTGLSFVAGQTLTVTASGSWDGGCGSVVGPDGGGPCGDYMPGFPYYALAGRIGTAGSYFRIGSSYSAPVTSSGHLFLAFTDNDAANNSGFVTANVVTAAVPEPGTYALLIAGLGVVGAVGRRRSRQPA